MFDFYFDDHSQGGHNDGFIKDQEISALIDEKMIENIWTFSYQVALKKEHHRLGQISK